MSDPTSADRTIPGLTIIGSAGSRDVSQAIIGEPTFKRPVSGAISLEFTLADVAPEYPILNDPLLTAWSYATYDQGGQRVNFELTSIGKGQGTDVKVGYTDAVAVHLSRQTGLLTIPAGTQTRQQIALRLARDAGVEMMVDPADRGVVNSVVERKADGNSWDLLGTLADDAGWRRFSDGYRVLFGSDEWLATLTAPQTFTENTDGVGPISFDLNVRTITNSITLVVDAELWGVPAGAPFEVAGLGLASGVWLVEEFSRPLNSVRGSVTGTRRALVIPEPPPEQTSTAGEAGEQSFLPSSSGTGIVVPAAGTYGGRAITGESMAIAVTIAKVAGARSLGKLGAVLGIMCGLQESGLRNLAGGDRDSVGVFQQRPSQGWGTVAQCRNVEYAAGKFYDALAKVTGWQSMEPTVAIQKVQRSAYPNAYAKHQSTAEEIVAAIVKANPSTSTSSSTSSTSGGTGTGLDKVADAGIALSQKVKNYVFGGKSLSGLDCSGFVQMTTRNVGKELAGGSKQQIATAQKAGVGCTVAEALKTRGALLFRGSTEPTHIAISLGDGRTVEARGTAAGVGIFTDAAKRVWTAGAKWAP